MKTQLILTGAMVALSGAQASAATLFGSTTDSRLISFDSATPGTLLSSVPISGLVDQFESVQGIDFRPLTGELFALGNAPGSVYRLYTINRSTGVATRIGSTDITLSGTFWGFDFNPTVDRIRVVSDAQTSLRLNPMTGAVAGTDTNLAASGIAAVGYDRNDNNAATPTSRFETQANIRTHKRTIRHIYIAYSARHFRTNYKTAMCLINTSITNNYILSWHRPFATRFITSRF